MLNLHDLRVELLQSEARHLLLFVFNKKQQMPRCARHDRGFLHQLAGLGGQGVQGSQLILKINQVDRVLAGQRTTPRRETGVR